MKNIAIVSVVFLMLSAFVFIACGNSSKKPETTPIEHKTDGYQCPMKCTEQTFDKPGVCPECGMELEKVIKG